MRSAWSRLVRALTIHPLWATMLTPLTVIVVVAVVVASALTSPLDPWLGIPLVIVMWTAVVYTILVTLCDMYVFIMATIHMQNTAALAESIKASDFPWWVRENGGEHLMDVFRHNKNVAELSARTQLELALHYERYLLSEPSGFGPLTAAMKGAFMLTILTAFLLMPRRLRSFAWGRLDALMKRKSESDALDD